MSDDTVTIDSSAPQVAAGFQRVADDAGLDDSADGDSAGFVLQQQGADKARDAREKGNGAAAGFAKASNGKKPDSGFTVSGHDSDGNGYTLGSDDGGDGLYGRKWAFIQPQWYMSDQHAMHYKRLLDRQLDKIIKRALQNDWQIIGLQMGIAGRVDGNPVLVRALNRRIQELAAGGDKVRPYIEMMGYRPEAVKEQLQKMVAYGGHIDDIMEQLKPAAPPPGAPGAAPGTPPAPP